MFAVFVLSLQRELTICTRTNHITIYTMKHFSSLLFSMPRMRKAIIASLAVVTLLVCATSLHAATGRIVLNNLPYTLDTIQMIQAGPGVEFWETRMFRESDGGGRLDAFFLRVDLTNPYLHLEQVLGKDRLIGTETPTSMGARLTTPTHVVVAGTNGDFFETTPAERAGHPIGLTIGNGEYALIGSKNRRCGGVNADGKVVIGNHWGHSGGLVLADTTLALNVVNKERGENKLVLYNHYFGTTTLTDALGTEVVAKLAEGEVWKTSGDVRLVIESVSPNTGNSTIPQDRVILSGHGTMAAELDKLQIGDEVIYRNTLTIDNQVVNMQQCIGSDNYVLILEDGVVAQSGYWDELHPRTCFGMTQTGDTAMFLVVDGRRGKSVGCTTKVLAELMQYNGAWRATNWDGGGSSCMFLQHLGQMNEPADMDGQRATCNGMMIVAEVPEVDSTITKILPYEYTYSVPYYGIYKPKFYGYNQYGLMIDPDVQGVALSCDASLGEIQEDGSFLASGTQDGVLHAALGDAKTTINIIVNRDAEVYLRLDSVLVDNRSSYEIEVLSRVEGNIVSLPARALQWTVEDEAICTVNAAGQLLGVSDGRTSVIGKMGNNTDTLDVHVQLPIARDYLWEDFADNTDTWNLKASPTSFKPTFVAPTEDNPLASLQFTGKTTRSPYILLEKDIPLYGLPDSIRIHFRTDAVVEKLTLALRANSQAATEFSSHIFEPIPTNVDTTLSIAMADLFDVTDRAIYPIWMKSLRFAFSTKLAAATYNIIWKGIELYYDGVAVNTSLDQASLPTWAVYPNPVEDGVLQVTNLTIGSSLILCDIQGRELVRQTIAGEQTQIDISAYPAGQYLLTIDNQTVKILKK